MNRAPIVSLILYISLIICLSLGGCAGVLHAAPPTLKLPTEVKGEPGDFVEIVADTDGVQVQWYVIDPKLKMFPVRLLKDSRIAVVTARDPGRYRLLAYTASDKGELSAPVVCTIVIGDAPKPPNPPQPPDPPKPPIPPIDPDAAALAEVLRPLYASIPGAAELKRQHLIALVGLYSAAEKTTGDKSITTLGDLFTRLRSASPMLLPNEALRPVRERLAKEMETNLPTAPSTPLDDALRMKTATLFRRFAQALDSLSP